MKRNYENIGVHVPEILLPVQGTDFTKWSVVACDQYTSQPDYWEEVESLVGDKPSTLRLTYPEIFLKEADKEERIGRINAYMGQYLKEGVLQAGRPGFILVDRSTSHVPSRKGLVLAVDLEKYDYNKGSQTLIRATEGTVLDRIPPRVKIRENALIELPHILLLIDDPDKTVIEPLFRKLDRFGKIYDFELMQHGGTIKGYKIEDEESIHTVAAALSKLADPKAFKARYGVGDDKGVLLFAAGDGNHSLATAKAHWESLKGKLSAAEAADHPARYALVEVVNVHDEGIVFEPIHRVLFNVDPQRVLEDLARYCTGSMKAEYAWHVSREDVEKAIKTDTGSGPRHQIAFITEKGYGLLTVDSPACNLEVGTLQTFLDRLAETDKHMEVDYIHGEDVVTDLGSRKGNMGFYLPAMDKHDLFRTVILDGVLPRKTFSMGEAEEKRYYLECRRIRML